MRIPISKNLLLIFISVFVGILILIISSEVIFFITHGDWYSNLGLHVRQKKRIDIIKDRDLISIYDQNLLHQTPDNDSALREYIELINFGKKNGVYRILCIGGSTTRGVGLEKLQSYPAFLEQMLDEIKPGQFEVFNLGLHSGTTWDFMRRFYRASADTNFGWKDLNPDLVILAPVWNDLAADLLTKTEMRLIGNLKWIDLLDYIKINLSSRCALGYYIYKALAIIHEKLMTKYYRHNQDFFIAELEPAKVRFRNRLIKIIDLWKARGVKIYLVVFPSLIEEDWSDELLSNLLKPNYPESAFFDFRQGSLIQKADREIITSIAREYKIRYFDFSDVVKGLAIPIKVRLFVDAIHLGPQLNYGIAEALFKGITSDLGLSQESALSEVK